MGFCLKGKEGLWEVVIGLEIHAQITSSSKLFSRACAKGGGGEANTAISLVDLAYPGVLPSLNKECVRKGVSAALAFGGRIAPYCVFDRKNYFYPDLPQGYQITQLYHPLMEEGKVLIPCEEGGVKSIRLQRLHIEQDAGKLLHDRAPSVSYVDFNRGGVGLLEIVSYPDLSSPKEAASCVDKIRSILRYIGVCDGNMQEGSLRADCNVSVRKQGCESVGERCEIKNLNSLKFIRQAVLSEAERQVGLLEGGGVVEKQTLLFDTKRGQTVSMRSKEEACDYRYFPDPDLLPLPIDSAWVEELRLSLPPLPDAVEEELQESYGLSSYDATVIAARKEVVVYYKEAAAGGRHKQVANWMISVVFGRLKKEKLSIDNCPVVPRALARLVERVEDGTLSTPLARDVFEVLWQGEKDVDGVIDRKGLRQLSDRVALRALLQEVLEENPKEVEAIKSGKDRLKGWIVGQAMKRTGGKANPKTLSILLEKLLR